MPDNGQKAEPGADGKVNVVGVRFRDAGKIYFFNPGQLELRVGNQVVVETARGIEFGTVIAGDRQVTLEETVTPLRDVIRMATPEDCAKVEENKRRAREAFAVCEKKIVEHGLAVSRDEVAPVKNDFWKWPPR